MWICVSVNMFYVNMYICMYLRIYVCMHRCIYVCTYVCICLRPENRPSVFAFFAFGLFRGGGGVGGGVGLSTSLVFVLHDLLCVGYVFPASVHGLHVALDTSSLLHCAHFMLGWICLLFFVAHAEQVGMKEKQLLALRFDHTHPNMMIVKMWQFCTVIPLGSMKNARFTAVGAKNLRYTPPKYVTYFGGHTFLSSRCSKSRIFHRSHWNCDAKKPHTA